MMDKGNRIKFAESGNGPEDIVRERGSVWLKIWLQKYSKTFRHAIEQALCIVGFAFFMPVSKFLMMKTVNFRKYPYLCP